jgi:hypothetical protein
MLSIQQLESNVTKLRNEIRYQETLRRRGVTFSPLLLNSLRTSLRAFELQLMDARYQQAEDEAERLESIREELLCAYGL